MKELTSDDSGWLACFINQGANICQSFTELFINKMRKIHKLQHFVWIFDMELFFHLKLNVAESNSQIF